MADDIAKGLDYGELRALGLAQLEERIQTLEAGLKMAQLTPSVTRNLRTKLTATKFARDVHQADIRTLLVDYSNGKGLTSILYNMSPEQIMEVVNGYVAEQREILKHYLAVIEDYKSEFLAKDNRRQYRNVEECANAFDGYLRDNSSLPTVLKVLRSMRKLVIDEGESNDLRSLMKAVEEYGMP